MAWFDGVMIETRLQYLERTGLLPMRDRDHYLRVDLSNISVCGRYNLNQIPDQTLDQPIPTDGRRLCGVCRGLADGTWARETVALRRDRQPVGVDR